MEKGNMSSKQLNFFITPEDYQRINEFIQRKGALVLLKEKISGDNKVEVQNEVPTNDIFQIYLTNKKYIEKVEINTTITNTHDIKSFGMFESYLMEFSLGGFYPYNRNVLQCARFYYIKSFWNNQDILEKKSDEFILWCNDFIKDFRKEFLIKYAKDVDNLYSESAIEWIEENNAYLVVGAQQWKKQL